MLTSKNSSILYLLFVFLFIINSSTVSPKNLKQKRQEIFTKTLHSHMKAGIELKHEIANPRRVTSDGKHLEYATLNPLSEIRPSDGLIRKRREIQTREANKHLQARETHMDGGHLVFYELGVHDKSSHLHNSRLKLERNYKLVSKNFVVEHRGKNGKIISRHQNISDCHYKGVIHNHSGFSKVAISLCNGMQGIIHKDNETYFIEPKWNESTELLGNEETHQHIITKRSIVEDQDQKDQNEIKGCGIRDDIETQSKISQQKTSEEERVLSRRKRSVSVERNVETLVVADKIMFKFHGKAELEKYLLTIMNVVSSLFHDATLGNEVNIIVTRMILLSEDQPGLLLNHHADPTLTRFCSWQSDFVGDQETSDLSLARHDNAVLVTGLDICSAENAPCGTLGVAHIEGMCDPKRSCSLNEDTGIATAHTIAHEIGHNFGMLHDSVFNNCGKPNGEPAKIMAPITAMVENPFQWSTCSRRYITDFIDRGTVDCLLDSPPERDFSFSDELPGQIYDASEQCRFEHGPGSRECNFGKTCRMLWCLKNLSEVEVNVISGCVTNNIPAAEGTNCTSDEVRHGWCSRGECVQFGYRPESRDGSWGNWSSWSECSTTCGNGVSHAVRSCDDPRPANGGHYCIGNRKRYKVCNIQDCPPNSEDYRSLQCKKFNNEEFRRRYYKWLPFYLSKSMGNPCALNCIADGQTFYSLKSKTVEDGTTCFPDSLDICIVGECHHVGCDNVLHSDAVEDKCRVCGGDGSSCVTHAGEIRKVVQPNKYHFIVTIPKGSVNIFVEEVVPSDKNFIALRGVDQTDYINGKWLIEWPQNFEIAGTTFSYKRSTGELESLSARGPTNTSMNIMTLMQEVNMGIKYEFNVPVDRTDGSGVVPESAFLWEFDQWSPCSASCAGGFQNKAVLCKRLDDMTVVQHKFCDSRTRPLEARRSCNDEPCPPVWFIGRWEECSSLCGGGRRTRLVMCMRTISRTDDETVPDDYCETEKPVSEEECNTEVCPPVWVASKWQRCSVTCGSGWKKRDVWCMSPDRDIRYMTSQCDARQKPVNRSQCDMDSCPPLKWRTYPWSTCSATCGHGQRKRRVVCRQGNQQVHPSRCNKFQRPKAISTCRSHVQCNSQVVPTRSGTSKCSDDPKVDYCNKVVKFGFCPRVYFQKMCCASCADKR